MLFSVPAGTPSQATREPASKRLRNASTWESVSGVNTAMCLSPGYAKPPIVAARRRDARTGYRAPEGFRNTSCRLGLFRGQAPECRTIEKAL
ncbi:hypothetical protein GCM10009016_10620 [Halomonas beimenensis]